MMQRRRVYITLPQNLVNEMDSLIGNEYSNRSSLVYEAITYYLRKRRSHTATKELIEGYRKMAEINLMISNEWSFADEEVASRYESKLAECE